jgi:hypothetical protein
MIHDGFAKNPIGRGGHGSYFWNVGIMDTMRTAARKLLTQREDITTIFLVVSNLQDPVVVVVGIT